MYINFEGLILERSRYYHHVYPCSHRGRAVSGLNFNKLVGAVFMLKNQNYLSGVFWPQRKFDFQKCFSCICDDLAVIFIANMVEIDEVVFSLAQHTTDN